jgi:uncharacterized protein (DUF1810 family)
MTRIREKENEMAESFNLQRFLDAQAPVYRQVLAELGAGAKRSHWMWFVFPQIAGLGRSETARFFAVGSRAEAAAYLAHPILGPRLRECCRLAIAVEGRSAREIFGSPDDMKFRSSLTLFAAVAPDDTVFSEALRKFFGGEADAATLARL